MIKALLIADAGNIDDAERLLFLEPLNQVQ